MKKQFYFSAVALIGALALSLVACNEGPDVNPADAEISLSGNEVAFDAAGTVAPGASTTFTVTGAAWSATDDREWITVTPASGADGETFTVAVTANEGDERTGTITVKNGSGSSVKTITVTQEQAEASAMEVSVNNLSFDAAGVVAPGGSATITVTGASWNVTDDMDWITVSPASGTDGETFTVTVTANEGDERTGTVTVQSVSGGDTKTVAVVQAGGQAKIYDIEIEFVYCGGSYWGDILGSGTGNFDIELSSTDGETSIGEGEFAYELATSTYSKLPTGADLIFAAGNYAFNSSYAEFTFDSEYTSLYRYDFEDNDEALNISEATLKVEYADDEYTLTFDLVVVDAEDNNLNVLATYRGPISFDDYSR